MNFFPDRVKKLQELKRMTVSEVLAYLDISPPMFSMIRNGTRNPSIKTIRRLEQAEIEAGIHGERSVSKDHGGSAASGAKREMLEEMEEIKKDWDKLSRRMNDLIQQMK